MGEVCFNTAMTGYQEIMTDPSFAGQIITFTFPHIGNVGANAEDVEADNPYALGMHRARGRDRAVATSARPSGSTHWLTRARADRAGGHRHARADAADPHAAARPTA